MKNKIREPDTPRKGSVLFSPAKRLICALLLLVVVIAVTLPMTAWAAWDGSGDISGGMNDVSGDTKLLVSNERNIVGYRFSIYNADGKKQGVSIDLEFQSGYGTLQSNAIHYMYDTGNGYMDKKSHIDINRDYQKYVETGYTSKPVSLGNPITHQTGTTNAANLVYQENSLKNPSTGYSYDPSTIGGNEAGKTYWLNDDRAGQIAGLCGAGSFNSATNYMIVEPLYFMVLNGEYYVLTSAEQAVYQAMAVQYARHTVASSNANACKIGKTYPNCHCGWTNVNPRTTALNPYVYSLGIYASGSFLRYLYATQEYGILGTKPVTDSILVTDGSGMLTISTPGHTHNYTASSGAKRYLNDSAGILEYQVGMAIYSHVSPNAKMIVNHYVEDQSNLGSYGLVISEEKAATLNTTITFANFKRDTTGYELTPSKTTYRINEGSWVSASSCTVSSSQTIEVNLYYTLKRYTVRWWNGSSLLQTHSNVPYGTQWSASKYTGATPTFSSDAQNNYVFSHWQTSSGGSPECTITSDMDFYAQKRSSGAVMYRQIVRVRYQNADGSWGSYSDVVNADYAYGQTVAAWSRGADTYYQAASMAAYTVTGAKTTNIDVYRRTSSVVTRVRYENADGSWSGWTNIVNGTYYHGASISGWSRGADACYQAASGYSAFTVTGAYSKDISVYRNWYTVTVTAGTGVGSVSGGGSYRYGSTATVSAGSLSANYHWTGWTGTYSTTANPYSFTVTQNASLTANASQDAKYTVSLSAGTGISSTSGAGTYFAGQSVTVSCQVSNGYAFVNWTGTYSSSSQTFTFTMPAQNVSLTANAKASTSIMYFADNINLITNFSDVGSTNSDRMTYSISGGVVTVRANYDDGYGFINARVYLEAGQTYAFSCNSNGAWGTVEAFLMLNGQYSTYYYMSSNNCVFIPGVTGTYWVRLDVNPNGQTYNFYNLSISKVVATKSVTNGSALGEMPSISRNGYDLIGWYDGTASRDGTIAWRNRPWIYYSDCWGDLYNAFGYNEKSLRTHYITHGGPVEGRRVSQYTAGDTCTWSGNKVVFAGWDNKTIRLTLDARGGSGHTSTVYYQYGINAFYTDWTCNTQISAITRPTLANNSYDSTYGFYVPNATCNAVAGERYISYLDVNFAGDLCTDIWVDTTLVCNWIPYYYLDLNGYLDGSSSGSIGGYGTCDIYINGSLVADDVADYYTQWPSGTTYEIKDIKTATGRTYNGVYSGSISGTITDTTNVYLNFSTASYGNTIDHWMWGFGGYGHNGSKEAYHIGSNYFNASYGSSYVMDGSRGTTAPKGFYLRSTFGTSGISGSWTNYSMGTTVTQPANGIGYEYDYDPYTYTISYNLNGGTNHASNPTSYNILFGKTLYAPSRTGYTFAGWYWQTAPRTMTFPADGGNNWHWQGIFYEVEAGKTYTITMDNAQLTAGSASAFTTLIYDFTTNTQLAGTTTAFGANRSYSITCPSNADPSHDIVIIVYAGTAGSTAGRGATYTNVRVEVNMTSGINPGATPSFVVGNANDMYTKLNARVAGDMTLVAKWTPNTVKITLDADGGTGHTPAVYFKYGINAFYTDAACTNRITSINLPTKTGYVYDTVYGFRAQSATCNATAGERYVGYADVSYGFAGDLCTDIWVNTTLKCGWTPITYKITYNGNGHTGGSTATSTHTYDVAANLTKNGYTKTGYIFTGWNTRADGRGTAYTDQQSVKNLTTINGATITLYAQWTPITYKVVYNSNQGLPAGYTRLNYIASSGSQWIDTGVSIGANTWVDAELMFTSAFGYNMMFGAWDDLSVSLVATNQVCAGGGGASTQNVGSPTTTNVRYNIKIGAGRGYTQDGVKYSLGGGSNIGTGRHILLFAASDASTGNAPYAWSSYGVGRIYSFRIYNGNTLVRDMIPCKNPSGVLGMYDLVEGKFYGNAGSGSFVAGETYTANQNGLAVGSTAGSDHTYDVSKNLTKNGFLMAGYTFTGWNTKPDGTGTSYTDQQSVKNLCTVNGGVVTLYAQWSRNGYSITYDHKGGSVSPANPTSYNVTTPTFTLKNPTRKGYLFDGWKRELITPNWFAGMINLDQGYVQMDSTYPNAVHSELIYLEAGVTYTISGTNLGGIRWRYYTTNGAYQGSVSGDTFTPSANCYASVLLYEGCTDANRKAAVISVSGRPINVSVVKGSTGNRKYVADWLYLDIEITAMSLKYKDSNGNYVEFDDYSSIPYGTTIYVFHTYRNNSDMTVDIKGYHQNSSGVVSSGGSTVFSLASGKSMTVLAGTLNPAIGANTATGYVYLNDYGFGNAAAEMYDGNNSKSVNFQVKFDVALTDIYLTSPNGVRVSEDWIAAGLDVKVYYTVKNNSAGPVEVDLYWDGVKCGTVTIPANSTQTVHVTTIKPTGNGITTYQGAIYRKGYTEDTEPYELNLQNNKMSYTVRVIERLEIELVDVDHALRKGTEVITTFRVFNKDIIPFPNDEVLTVYMYVYDANGNLILEMQQQTVIPAEETQLVWFRWVVPEANGPYTIKGVLIDKTYDANFWTCEGTRSVVGKDYVATPDTSYEADRPADWTRPGKPTSTPAKTITWFQWSYNTSTGKFVKTNYGLEFRVGSVTISPVSQTAYKKNGTWYMKSGYGFTLDMEDMQISALSGYTAPDAQDYTGVQWAYALFPEFSYKKDNITTLEKIGATWRLPNAYGYGDLHHTPIWYPDSTGSNSAYYVRAMQTDVWTPMGVVSMYTVSNGIMIQGDMYDDWYTQ